MPGLSLETLDREHLADDLQAPLREAIFVRCIACEQRAPMTILDPKLASEIYRGHEWR